MKSPEELIQKYHESKLWYEKCLIILMYHTVMCGANKDWTIRMTAKRMDRSAGLISEDLRLAACVKQHEKMLQAVDRQSAMKLMKDYEG